MAIPLAHGQNETKKWYFGFYAGLDFVTSPPTVLTNGTLTAYEGCASISDNIGNLVLYTDGISVYNNNHVLMSNGSGLFGNASSTQSGLILKKPGSSTIYYVFSQEGPTATNGGCYYSIVDMNLSAGSGSVITKNVPLYLPSTEKMVATRHCNGVDFWIITRDELSPNFRCFLLTSTGISTLVVTSPANISVSGYIGAVGYLKVSPNGRKLANTAWNNSLGYEIYDFDNTTGLISNPIPLGVGMGNGYGCEFSPDGTKFYGGAYGTGCVYQWNLCAGNANAISASSIQIQGSSSGKGAYQLAADGKIYIARYTQSCLAVINNPNNVGTACNYVEMGQTIGSGVCSFGLPNIITSDLKTPPAPFTHTVSNSYGCQTASFTAPPSINNFSFTNCSASGYSFTGMQWIFGDPGSGSANTSTLTNPAHAFTNLGTYTVSLVLYYTCGGGTDTIKMPVNIIQPCVSVTSTSITCSNLGSATIQTLGGNGPFSYTWIPSNQTGSVATGLSPGVYTITVKDMVSNFIYTFTTAFNPPLALTGNLNNTNSITCNGAATGTAAYTNIAGGSGNQTYLFSNGLSSFTTSYVNTLSAGLWSATVTDALTGCVLNNMFLVLQPSAQTLNLGATSPTACVGFSAALSGTNTGGTPNGTGPAYTYSWSGGPASNSWAVTQNVAGTYVYNLSAFDSYSCPVTQTIQVDFIPNPILTVANVSVCPLQTGTLSVSGASTYVWNTSAVGSTFTDNPVSSTQYTVIGLALGCTSTAVAGIYIKPVPNPVILSNSPVCENSTFSLSANSGAAYVWSGPNSYSSLSSLNFISNIALNQAGAYHVTVTAANLCTAAASHTVTVKPLPTLTLSASAASICLNTNSATLFASGTATLFNWLPNQNISSNTSASVVASPTVTKTYTLTATLNGCSVSKYQTVNVVAPPSLSLALSSNSFCARAFNGSPNTITLTSSGANTYTLSTPNHFNNPYPSGPSSPINLMTPFVNTGPATATLFGSNGVCTLSMSANFTVIPNPTVSVANPTPVICAGQSYTYTSNGASSYVWSSANAGNTLYTTGNVAVANPSINAVFSVFGGSLGCNSALLSTSITVNPLPVVEVLPNPTFVCIGNATELFAKSNATTFTWSPANSLNNQSSQTVLVAPNIHQIYTVIASLNNCTQSAMATVSVMALPNPTIINTEPVMCVSKQITLNAFGGSEYTWRGPNNFIGSGQELKFTPINLTFAGVYSVTVKDANNCFGTSTTTIEIEPLPDGSILYNQKQGCVPLQGNYSFSSPINPNERLAGIYWTLNDNVMLDKSSSFKYLFNQAGNYKITAFVKGENTCDNQFIINVNVFPKPLADFTFTPNKPVENLDIVEFFESSEGADKFSWYLKVAPDKNINLSGGSPNYLFENSGLFPIVLVASNKWDCSDTIIKTIKVEPDFGVYVPNAFTPNGDGKNEVFIPVLRGVKFFSFEIYNRWGQKVFESSDLNNGWDGTYNGLECKQDVFDYNLSLSTLSGEARVYLGSVTLYR